MTLNQLKEAQLLVWSSQISIVMSERGLSQAKLARMMDVNRATLCRLLQARDSKVSTYLTAFRVLGIHVEFTADHSLQKSA